MSTRCFISVDIEDQSLLDSLENIQRSLEDTGADLKSVERENIHITIWFLGDVGDTLLPEVQRVVSDISFDPFKVEFRGIEAFPNPHRPRVIVTEISEGFDRLASVFKRLRVELEALGFMPDERGFTPHVTLARVRSGRNRDQLVEELITRKNEALGHMMVRQIRLKKSVLTQKGPIYSTISESRG